MKIKRIDSYIDDRFSKKVLQQHGAFLIDDCYPCEFEIINMDTAVIKYHDLTDTDAIIDEFRFYAEHIVNFCDVKGNVIKSFFHKEIIWVEISKIQPSQYYVDKDKVNAVKTFINTESDIVIPLIKSNGRFISLDGHTRLYIANGKGFRKVQGFITSADDTIYKCVEEAINRSIYSITDVKLVNQEQYLILCAIGVKGQNTICLSTTLH